MKCVVDPAASGQNLWASVIAGQEEIGLPPCLLHCNTPPLEEDWANRTWDISHDREGYSASYVCASKSLSFSLKWNEFYTENTLF